MLGLYNLRILAMIMVWEEQIVSRFSVLGKIRASLLKLLCFYDVPRIY